EGFLESVVAAELGIDGIRQLASRCAAAIGLHAAPEEGVVPDLGGVVVDAAAGLLDDLFQRQSFKLGAGDQVVQVGDVSLMVLAVVVLKSFGADVRSQSVLSVRQWGKRMCHGAVPDGWVVKSITIVGT